MLMLMLMLMLLLMHSMITIIVLQYLTIVDVINNHCDDIRINNHTLIIMKKKISWHSDQEP